MDYQKEDRNLQLQQNAEIKENTRLTKMALWATVVLGIGGIVAQYLWH
jgi:hypothetical protein